MSRLASSTLHAVVMVDPETLRPVNAVEGPVRAALAVWIGKTDLSITFFANPRF
jgi:hypothetical protein